MKKRTLTILGVVQAAIAIGALPAGYLFIIHPDGSGLGMTTGQLAGSPFKSYLIPGLYLFIVNGLFNLISSILAFTMFRYSAYTGILLGSGLIIWILVQIYSVGLNHFLQPAYFIIGLIELLLGIALLRQLKAQKAS
jgi:hypothetical protein